MDFLKIISKHFEYLVRLLSSCFLNTSSHHDDGDRDQTTWASSSSTPLLRQNYEVFLNFRGEDTRYGFTDHLYHGLVNRGIIVFKDSEGLYVGEKIDQLFEAIKSSRISIPIISPDYASSIWCLKELLQILKCKKTLPQLVLPIFYHVKPSDVREQKGHFGKKFQLCKRNHGLDRKLVQELENAFIEVAALKGWESKNIACGHEGELVKVVVTRIFNELRKAILVVPDFLVGVEKHVKEIKKKIDGSPFDEAKIIGIHGMGGIGKTTLAKVLYNALSNDFECHSFVPNIREASKNKGIEALQKQIISNVLVDKSLQEISHVDEGITIIEKSFRGKRLLLFLDDVENREQLNNLAAKHSWFGSESVVIITTRNKDVVVGTTVNMSYELNELNSDHSYELFCKHAFGRGASAPRDLETIVRDIISITGGLPLAIEIIGSLLCQKDEDFWKETLEKLRRLPNEGVRDKLKVSYDLLEHGQQQIFLDIACLPVGDEPDIASYMWKSCGFYPKEGIERLISLSLVKVEAKSNRLIMHDQLKDLGRAIVHEEGRNNIGLCSRIWLQEAIEVIERKQQGTPNVQALILPSPLKSDEGAIHCTSQHFEGMTNLRFLRIPNMHLIGDFGNLFLNLRWLRWGSYNEMYFDIMGINFNPKKLEVLELFKSNITEHWNGWNQMKNLKILRLMYCIELTTTPDLSTLKELKLLSLRFCTKLRKIHPSIGKLSKTLKVLHIEDCDKLEDLPVEVGEMEELRQLNICFNGLRKLPDFKGHTTKLESLWAGICTKLLYIPDSLGSLVKLRHLDLFQGQSLTKIPESIGKLKLLIRLNLSLTSIKELPDSIGELCNLESLLLWKTPIKFLPTSIGMLSKLQELDLGECKELESMPKLPSTLTDLRLSGYSMETPPEFSHLTNVNELSYRDLCERRNIALNLGSLNQLETLWISGTRVEDIHIAPENFSLQLELPGSLLKLDVFACQTLRTFPNLSDLKYLSRLCLINCFKLTEIHGLGGLESLTNLEITGCKKLSILGDFTDITVV